MYKYLCLINLYCQTLSSYPLDPSSLSFRPDPFYIPNISPISKANPLSSEIKWFKQRRLIQIGLASSYQHHNNFLILSISIKSMTMTTTKSPSIFSLPPLCLFIIITATINHLSLTLSYNHRCHDLYIFDNMKST